MSMLSRQVKMTLITFFVAIFRCQDEQRCSSSRPQCAVSGLKQGEWTETEPQLVSATNLESGTASCRMVGKGPEFILWKSTRCSRLGNLVLAPSREKAFLPV